MDIRGKKVLVFGSGISGEAAAGLLAEQGAQIILYDGNEKLDRDAISRRVPEGAEIILGAFPEELADSLALVVMSPGVPVDLPVVERMKERGIPVWGEIELAYTYAKGDVLAITGTNGKTTTTTLLGEIMKAAAESVFIVGNIGTPYTGVASETKEDSVTVAEISSFQLETVHSFRPKVSAILNITPDHLNRHHTMEAYIAAKERITENQTPDDYCVLNYEDDVLRRFGESVRAQVLYFSSRRKLNRGVYLDGDRIICGIDRETEICRTGDLQILGVHNYENVMAAVAMAYVYGVPVDVIRRVVTSFKGVEHRIEFVAEKNGVAYYNDSKGTNPDAAIRGIRAMNRSAADMTRIPPMRNGSKLLTAR